MCGRFTLRAPDKIDLDLFGLVEAPDIKPSYNVAPSQVVAVVRARPEGAGRQLVPLVWGLVPSWSRDTTRAFINARSETAAIKPVFRSAYRKRRCLVLADGFFEWQRSGGRKQPHFFRLKDDGIFAFAGLWDCWQGDGEPFETCSILTTQANDVVRGVHDRMPVILRPTHYDRWLDPTDQAGLGLEEILRPYPPGEMVCRPVSTRVNSPRNNDPACVEPLAPPALPGSTGGTSLFTG